jgi:hypothetical protein
MRSAAWSYFQKRAVPAGTQSGARRAWKATAVAVLGWDSWMAGFDSSYAAESLQFLFLVRKKGHPFFFFFVILVLKDTYTMTRTFLDTISRLFRNSG